MPGHARSRNDWRDLNEDALNWNCIAPFNRPMEKERKKLFRGSAYPTKLGIRLRLAGSNLIWIRLFKVEIAHLFWRWRISILSLSLKRFGATRLWLTNYSYWAYCLKDQSGRNMRAASLGCIYVGHDDFMVLSRDNSQFHQTCSRKVVACA